MINPTPAYLIPTQFTHAIYMIHILQRDLWILLFILRKENPIYYVCLQWEYDLQTFKAITKADICHNQEIKSLFIKNVTHEWRDLSLILCEQGLWPRVPTLSVKINQKVTTVTAKGIPRTNRMGALYKLIFFSTDITNLQKITIMKGHKKSQSFLYSNRINRKSPKFIVWLLFFFNKIPGGV